MGHEGRQSVVELGAVDNAKIDPVLLALDRKVAIRTRDSRVDHRAADVTADLNYLMSSQVFVFSCPSSAEPNQPKPLWSLP